MIGKEIQIGNNIHLMEKIEELLLSQNENFSDEVQALHECKILLHEYRNIVSREIKRRKVYEQLLNYEIKSSAHVH